MLLPGESHGHQHHQRQFSALYLFLELFCHFKNSSFYFTTFHCFPTLLIFPPITCWNIENTVSGRHAVIFSATVTGENASDEVTAQHSLTSSLESVPRRQAKMHRTGAPRCCWRSRDDGQGACSIFRVIAFVCPPGENKRGVKTAQVHSVTAVGTPCSLRNSPKARTPELWGQQSYRGGESREGAVAEETAEAGGRRWEQPDPQQRERPGDLRDVLRGLEPAGEALAPGGGGRAWPQQGWGAGSRGKGWTTPASAPWVPESLLVSLLVFQNRLQEYSHHGSPRKRATAGQAGLPALGTVAARVSTQPLGTGPLGVWGALSWRSQGRDQAHGQRPGWAWPRLSLPASVMGPTRPRSQS